MGATRLAGITTCTGVAVDNGCESKDSPLQNPTTEPNHRTQPQNPLGPPKKKAGRGRPASLGNEWKELLTATQTLPFATLAAWGPFGPWTISNSTGSPSCKVR